MTGFLGAICRDCDAALLLADERTAAAVADHLRGDDMTAARPIVTLDAEGNRASGWHGALPDPSGIALLQYTSGSIGRPKGVMVTHGNLVANLEQQCRRFGVGAQSRLVTWLPPYHDMGLVAGILQAPYSHCTTTILPPLHAMQRPIRWLRAIQSVSATISAARRSVMISARRRSANRSRRARSFLLGMRLRRRRADRAAQPRAVRARFRAVRLQSQHFRTVLRHGRGDADGRPAGRSVGAGMQPSQAEVPGAAARPTSGSAVEEHQLLVVDPDAAEPQPEGISGEIWVRGASVAAGYWNDPARSEAVFRARLADGRFPWLRTGDLGVIVRGELTVTGRIKDLVIFAGRKLHAEDIETSLRGVDGITAELGTIAAFAADIDGRERPVIAAELRRRTIGESNGGLAAATDPRHGAARA